MARYSSYAMLLVASAGFMTTHASEAMAQTEAGPVVVESCYDETTKSLELTVNFFDVADAETGELPWLAIGYRNNEACLMTPSDGGNTDIILLASSQDGTREVAPFHTVITPVTKGTKTFTNLTSLEDIESFSNVMLHLPGSDDMVAVSRSAGAPVLGSVSLHFQQSVEQKPEIMHLMYAIGMSAEFGYHPSRECFDITEFPVCGSVDSTGMVEGAASASSIKRHSAAVLFGVLAAAFGMMSL